MTVSEPDSPAGVSLRGRTGPRQPGNAVPRPWRPGLRFTPSQIIAHSASWIPAILIGVDYVRGDWTVNPIQYLTFRTGWAAITLLAASLACTPASSLLGFKQALKLRRPLGLYAFFYALAHFLIFVGLDYGLDLNLIYEAIFEKRYALVGFGALLILLPMALTSTKGWQRRLGKNWKRLHRLVYVAAILAVIHYIWLVKSDIRKPLVYAAIVTVLLAARTARVRQALVDARSWIVRRALPEQDGEPKPGLNKGVDHMDQQPDDQQSADLEAMWAGLLSGDAGQIRRIWNDLTDDEAKAVVEHLQKMMSEEGFSEEQKQTAQKALEAIQAAG